jgi:hypothetical protein
MSRSAIPSNSARLIYVVKYRLRKSASGTVQADERSNLPGRKGERSTIYLRNLLSGNGEDDLIVCCRHVLVPRRRPKTQTGDVRRDGIDISSGSYFVNISRTKIGRRIHESHLHIA